MRLTKLSIRCLAGVSLAALVALAPQTTLAAKAGVTSAVNVDANRTPPGLNTRQVVVGDDIVFNERIDTDANGQAQILMLDRTAITIGPNSTLVIDKFVYDPETKQGDMALTLRRGLLRFVGGAISKTRSVGIDTPIATVGIRGGVGLVDVVSQEQVDATFLFGEQMTIAEGGRVIETVSRPGFFTRVSPTGATAPRRADPGGIAGRMAQLQGRAGASGGLNNAPNPERIGEQLQSALPNVDLAAIGLQIEKNLPKGDLQRLQRRLHHAVGDAQQRLIDMQLENNGDPIDPIDPIIDDIPIIGFARITPFGMDGEELSQTVGLTGLSDGDGFFTVTDGSGVLEGFAPTFFANGEGPNTIMNPFAPDDLEVYRNPELVALGLVSDGLSASAANMVAGPVFSDPQFFVQTYTARIPGVDGEGFPNEPTSHLTVIGGVPFDGSFLDDSLRAYDMAADTHRISRFVFSRIGEFDLEGPTPADIDFELDFATQTPMLFDGQRGKVFLANMVEHGDLTGLTDYAFQVGVVVGDFGGAAGGDELLTGGGEFITAGRGEISAEVVNASEGNFVFAFGDNADLLLIAGTVEDASATSDPFELDFAHVGLSTPPDVELDVGFEGSETETLQLYAATHVHLGSGGSLLIGLANDGVASTRESPGTLLFDRVSGTVSADIVLEQLSGFTTLNFAGSDFASAYLNDDTFGIGTFGYSSGTGSFLVSGAVFDNPHDTCTCEFLRWGYWAALEDTSAADPMDPTLANNSNTALGVFVAGAPTPDMPISGSATYNGVVEASLRQPLGINPEGLHTFGRGTINHTIDFSTGLGTGNMTLADRAFDTNSAHTPGAPLISFNIVEDVVGATPATGTGDGIFAGPQAINIGASFTIQGFDDYSAAGTIRAARGAIGGGAAVTE